MMKSLKQSLARSEPLLIVALLAAAFIVFDQHRCLNMEWINGFFFR